MPQHKHFKVDQFARDIVNKQIEKDIGTRELSREANIGASNITRLYNEHSCGIETFCALCKWAGFDANWYLK